MTPGARVQAAIELLDEIIDASRQNGAAADTLIARYFAARRYAGSKDRRAVRDHVYDAIRLCGERPENGRAAMLAVAQNKVELAKLFDGEGHSPALIGEAETPAEIGAAPRWLIERMHASGVSDADLSALLDRAPLDLRVNRLRSTREAALTALEQAEPVDGVPDALRLEAAINIETTQLWRNGGIEVQDLGSQIVAGACNAQSGMTVVDLCAGGGGKTLALAAQMGDQGKIIASDTDRGRLSRLMPRAERAGVSIVETRLLNPGREMESLDDLKGRADIVCIDAPCSGTGTWRRNPEARWRQNPERIERYAATQARLLDLGASLVKPSGTLIHIVCSLLDEEGKDQVQAFLDRHTGWRADDLHLPRGSAHGHGFRLSPKADQTDGFFVAKLIAP